MGTSVSSLAIEKMKTKQEKNTFKKQFNALCSRISKGDGLTLAITFKLVQGLNGYISVKSEPGEWTEFGVDLPYIDVGDDER